MENIKKINLPFSIVKILKRLELSGFEAYAVGGAIRDKILGLNPKDWDVTTNAKPEEVINIFYRFNRYYRIIETGLKHGTITLMVRGFGPVEVTTYRIDGDYLDNRRPDSVLYTGKISQDLQRRDFTINSLIANSDGEITDFFDGKFDIKAKLIKCVGIAEERFKEDALRILRALRFASKLGFKIEEKTSEAIHNFKHLLKNISAERIQKELNGILSGQNVKRILLDYFDVFEVFMTEISETVFEQHSPYHKNNRVLEHTANVVENVTDIHIQRLAALFHDFGKKRCFTQAIDAEGKVIGHFYGHPAESAVMAKDIMQRLKYSNEEIEKVVWLVKHHDCEIAETTKSVKKLLNKTPYPELFDLLLDLKESDKKDHNVLEQDKIVNLEKIYNIKKEILKKKECFSLKDLAVNGYDMIQLGLKGKDIGIALNILLNAVIDEMVENDKEKILEFIKKEEA